MLTNLILLNKYIYQGVFNFTEERFLCFEHGLIQVLQCLLGLFYSITFQMTSF